ncbi:hypothetical protein [Virgisporangium aliadipatigenens]|nr:hypothetical protein [Virgisporangium aliadipatigenens]
MTKLDITNVPRELDELIRSSADARHRRILENVRRHYLLEQTGRIDEILAPDMTVAAPVYYLNLDGASRTLRGRAEVLAFYKEVVGVVFACEETAHAITDAGYWFEAWFNFFVPGRTPDEWFRKRQWITMRWPYDAHARLIGERVFEHVDIGETVPIDPAEAITAAEAKKILEPLIRPLPTV